MELVHGPQTIGRAELRIKAVFHLLLLGNNGPQAAEAEVSNLTTAATEDHAGRGADACERHRTFSIARVISCAINKLILGTAAQVLLLLGSVITFYEDSKRGGALMISGLLGRLVGAHN